MSLSFSARDVGAKIRNFFRLILNNKHYFVSIVAFSHHLLERKQLLR